MCPPNQFIGCVKLWLLVCSVKLISVNGHFLNEILIASLHFQLVGYLRNSLKKSQLVQQGSSLCVCLRLESDGKTPLLLLPFACEALQAFCENRLPKVRYRGLGGVTCPREAAVIFLER